MAKNKVYAALTKNGLTSAAKAPEKAVQVSARRTETLAEAGLSILAISTYDTDYVFVKARHLTAALKALQRAGHQITS